MTQILFQRCDGKPAGAPVALPRGRRRLSTVMRRHGDRSRPHIVSVHRKKHLLAVTDMSVRLRKHWCHTWLGPHDTIIVTYLPQGGGQAGTGGGSRAGKGASIGLLVGAIALAAVGQFWAIGALAPLVGGTGVAGAIWAAGSAALLAGGGYLLSRATQAKANKSEDNRPVYGVSGGGNQPRSGDRIPVIYGRTWTTPDLSQPDYTVNDGDDQVLYKRLTLGCGKCSVKTIRVSNVVMWTSDSGVTPPFVGAQIEYIPPGGASSLVPGQVASVQAITGNELKRPTEFPAHTGPFDFGSGAPLQSRIQLDFSLPSGCMAVPDGGKFKGEQYDANWGVHFEYAPCDEDGEPIGGWQTLHVETGRILTTRAMRFTRFAEIPAGRYTFRAQNIGDPPSVPHPSGFSAIITNPIVWEGLRAHIPQAAVRPGISELALKIRSGKDLGVTSYGEVEVEVQRILPVWFGPDAGWIEQETSKSVWAAADILRDQLHGAAMQDGAVDLERLRHYATTLTQYDEFNGVIRGPVSVYEALTTVLGPMRASPLRLARSWTIVRDEPRAVRKHVITRRQILKDSSGQSFNLDLSDGSADIIVEWFTGGDPRKRREHRVTFGPQTMTPRRMQALGATSAAHAIHIATWAAATAHFRRERRSFSMELAGRLLLPNDKALIDTWYFDGIETVGVVDFDIDDLTLMVDRDDLDVATGYYAYLRARDGKDWGPVGFTQEGNRLVLNAADVAQAQSMTGLSLEQALNTATQAFTSVVIGTLGDIQDAWLIRSIQPSGENLNVEAVFDAPQVWSALAEPIVVPPPPPSTGLENEATIAVPYVAALPVQRNAAMFMDWTTGRARSAATYVVEISYDNWVTSEEAYRGPSSNGSHPLRQTTGVIYVRAFALAASGLRSQYVFTQFSVVPAIIDLGNAGAGTLPYKAFLAGMEPVAIVDHLPDLFGYQGPKVVTLFEPGQKPKMYQLREGGTDWELLAAEDYVANSITAAALQVGAVKATAIDVAYLSAISAQMGSILGGSLNINNRFFIAADGTLTMISGASGRRTVITSSLFQVFDDNGQLRVRMGIW